MRQIVRQISIYFFTLSILTVVGYLLLVLVYTIPANKFKQSLTESAPFFYAKSDPTTAPLDYFTDALMLLTAAEPIDETPWKAALINARKSVNDKSPNEVFCRYLFESKHCCQRSTILSVLAWVSDLSETSAIMF